MSRPLPELSSFKRSSFLNKPPQGWAHSDQLIMKSGKTYAVRECINRVCETAGLKTADKKRKIDKTVQKCIGDKPIMDHAGANVNLTVSSNSLTLTAHDSGKIIAEHEMPRISFASGGDTDTLDFVGYVAKDLKDWRACYVLECGGGLAQDVIATIAQAFELRLKQFLSHTGSQKIMLTNYIRNEVAARSDVGEYYNDLPGKIPPDVGPPPVPPLPHHAGLSVPPSEHSSVSQHLRDGGTNLIDLNSEPSSVPQDLEYVNVVPSSVQNASITTTNDVFDLKHLGARIKHKQIPLSQKNQLENEIWFHGFVNRQEAEAMLNKDGEFLVRESQGSPGQYVLTGMQGGVKKHLLLIDPEGVVRTKDKMFESVNHLIDYHVENQLPIISAESALVLKHPVPKIFHSS